MPNFKALYKKDSEIFEKFKVEAEFGPLNLEAFDDSVDAVIKLNKEFPLLPSSAGELLGLDKFENMIDPDIERPDPNKRGVGFTNEKGERFDLEK